MIVLDVSRPPTTNSLYANVPGRGRIKSERYRTWLRSAGNELLAQMVQSPCKSINGSVRLYMAIGEERNKDGSVSKRKQDISNRIKALEDLIVSHGLIEDDSMVRDLHIRYDDDIEPRRIRVTIQPVSEEG